MSEKIKPLVSIIIPVYNGERFLRETLDSIIGQTYSRIEILVMDDASTDATQEIVASYGNQLKYFHQPQNKGQFQNINDGIEMVSGEFIAIYHADDVYEQTIVEQEVAYFEHYPEIGAVFCYDIFINAEGHEYGRLKIPTELEGRPFLNYQMVLNGILTHKNRFLPTPGCMVRVSVYKQLGTFRGSEYKIASDLDMWLRIARHYPIGILPKYLFSYRHGHGNLSQKYYHVRTEQEKHFQILDEHLVDGGYKLAVPEALAAHEAHRAEDHIMVAINHYILGNNKEARTFLRRVKLSQILGSAQVKRARLLILFFALKTLLKIPRIPLFANLFYRRWHVKNYSV